MFSVSTKHLDNNEGNIYHLFYFNSFLVAQMVNSLPAIQETWVQVLGQKDPLEKGMAANSSILIWRIPCKKEPGGLPVIICVLSLFYSLYVFSFYIFMFK